MENFTDRAPIHLWFNAVNHDLLGEPEIAKDYVNKIKEKYEENDSGSPAWFLAMYYFSNQNIDTGFEWLEKSFKRHEVEMTWIQAEPLLQPYKQDERYKAIHAQINFPQILKD